jgi:O-acetylhomoserine/O-acetylserine sulfhydrylase-like pyridoxal-dependent enzyme
MAIDADMIPIIDRLEARIAALEGNSADAEATASLAFQAVLFPTLAKSNDRVALWNDLTAFLKDRV